MSQAQVVTRVRERIEKLRTRGQMSTQRLRERIEKFRRGGASTSGSLVSEIREKGLVETLRERREAWRKPAAGSPVGQKQYKKELALESSAGQLKIQKGRAAIEA